MIINFLQYRIPCDQSMFINEQCVERVHSFKLNWMSIYQKTTLPGIPTLTISWRKLTPDSLPSDFWRKPGSHWSYYHLLLSYSLNTWVYASPVWAALPDNLSSHLESVQKRALKIIYPDISYYEALQTSKLKTLECRRDVRDLSTQSRRKHVITIQSII
jgi:hypothetical protein